MAHVLSRELTISLASPLSVGGGAGEGDGSRAEPGADGASQSGEPAAAAAASGHQTVSAERAVHTAGRVRCRVSRTRADRSGH